jgi:hypothetical protein
VIWLVIWSLWGVLSGLIAEWQGGERKLLGPAIAGAILGIFGGLLGNRVLGPTRRTQVIYWAAYWALFWAVWFIVPALLLGVVSRSIDGLTTDISGSVLLSALQGAAVGAIGGTLGADIQRRLGVMNQPT